MKGNQLEMTLLFDYYGDLLTEKQKTCFDLYYNQDLSLSEIAEQAGISRQGVHDTLVRAEAQLEQFEAAVGCIARAAAVQEAAERIEAAAASLKELPQARKDAETILRACEALKE